MNPWTIMPDWSNGVTETLIWLTDVLQGQSAAEQRRQLRVTPRRQIEFDFICQGPERTLLDLAISQGGAAQWLVPLFFDISYTTAQYNAGSTTIGIDTTYTEFLAGTQVLIYGDAFNYEVKTIQSLSNSTMTFSAVTSKSWPKGTAVYPLRAGMLTDQPTPSKLTSRVMQGTMRFQMTGNNGFAPAFEYGDAYNGFPVLPLGGNERDGIDVGWERMILDLDGDTGIVTRTDTSGFAFTLQKLSRMVVGKAAHSTIRSLLYALRGQLIPVWLPTFAEDLTLVSSTLGGYINVRMCGYTQYGTGVVGRRDVMMEMFDGTRYYFALSGSQVIDANTEQINISMASFGKTITPDAVKRISFMSLSRQSTDSIDILHHTDNMGVAEVVLSFRGAPETRNVV